MEQALKLLPSDWHHMAPSWESGAGNSDLGSENEEQTADSRTLLPSESEMSFEEKFRDWTKRNTIDSILMRRIHRHHLKH